MKNKDEPEEIDTKITRLQRELDGLNHDFTLKIEELVNAIFEKRITEQEK